MNFVADFLACVGLTVTTLLPIINPVGTAVPPLGVGAIAGIFGFFMICIGAHVIIDGVRELIGS